MLVAVVAAALAQPGHVEVLYSEAPDHSSATVPGALDLSGKPAFTEFKAMEEMAVTANGRRWLLRARNHLGSDLETMYLLGTDDAGTMLIQEGQPVMGGAPGEVYDFMGTSSPPAFDSTGRFCLTARARGGDSSIKHKGHYHDGTTLLLIREESDPALGLLDIPSEPTGDELFGNSFGSMHPLDDGRIGSLDPTIQNISSFRRPAIFYDDTAFRQKGVHDIGEHLWDTFDLGSFRTTPDGSSWLVIGRDDSGTASDTILAVNDLVVLREGTAVAGSSIVMADVFAAHLGPSGHWFARGDDPLDDDWAVANGALIASTGSSVVDGSEENWGAGLLAIAGNSAGEWVLVGDTDADEASNEVLVLNGDTILAREGDPVDLDGNGVLDDDAYIGRGDPSLGAFRPNDVALTDDGWVYFIASLRTGEGEDLGEFGTGGDAFMRLFVGGECFLDLDLSGAVDVGDLLIVLGAWGQSDHEADLDGSGVVDVGDLLLILAGWGPC